MENKLINNSSNFISLAGKMLVANPYCSFGDIFHKAIIYIVSHSEQGALGLIINKYVSDMGLKKLFKLNEEIGIEHNVPIFIGGPVEPERSFVLHTQDYNKNILFEPQGNLVVSSNQEIVKDIINGKGPEKSLIILGYTGWGADQLEIEIENNYWLIEKTDLDIIFDTDYAHKWEKALDSMGIDNTYFTSQMGHS